MNATCNACLERYLIVANYGQVYACASCPSKHFVCGRCRWFLDLPLDDPCTDTVDFDALRVGLELMGPEA